MQIRKAQTADLSQLALLFDQYRIFYEKPTDMEGAANFLEERMNHRDSEIFVAENADHQLVGFVQLYPLFSSTRMKRLWLLNDLFVTETQRGQGISKKLIEAAKALCRDTGACGLMLETAKSNVEGNALYPKMGFELDTGHNFYSWDND